MPEELTIHIYPSDCDSAGHVNHAVLLTLLERARWAALEKYMKFEDYIRRAQWAVVRKVDASYSNSALPGDELIIRTGLMKIGNTSFTVKQVAKNQHDAVVCDLMTVYVTLDEQRRPMTVPDEWRSIFPDWED
ncbi:MAG: acyl-CoA thioesterase [Gemmatimonadaceae bacterium]